MRVRGEGGEAQGGDRRKGVLGTVSEEDKKMHYKLIISICHMPTAIGVCACRCTSSCSHRSIGISSECDIDVTSEKEEAKHENKYKRIQETKPEHSCSKI